MNSLTANEQTVLKALQDAIWDCDDREFIPIDTRRAYRALRGIISPHGYNGTLASLESKGVYYPERGFFGRGWVLNPELA